MKFEGLIQLLLDFSERAAVIARSIREEDNLFQLLIEEKTGAQKNQRFAQDFKTLADVLIQQSLSHAIGKHVKILNGRVYGEECATFCNSLGEVITVSIQDSQEETSNLLAKVLNGKEAADILAHHVHREINCGIKVKPSCIPDYPMDDLGIWIDPIDSTGEYIKGTDFPFYESEAQRSATDDPVAGLCCVTVLLGVFDVKTGLPVAGVINQPFATSLPSADGVNKYCGRLSYGICNTGIYHLTAVADDMAAGPLKRVCLSSSESPQLFAKLRSAGIEPVAVAGAGFKSLIVATGHVQVYLCTKGSTFMWDTCAPHALLISMGGGLVPASSLPLFCQARHAPAAHQVKYVPGSAEHNKDASLFCNSEGVVAYRHEEHLRALAKALA